MHAAAQVAIADATAAYGAAVAEAERLRRRLQQSHARVQALEGSRSWRLTRPLRALRRLR
jgi:hypothetical protein